MICKNCGQENDPRWDRKYKGYCLSCVNAGADEKNDEIARLRAELATVTTDRDTWRELYKTQEILISESESQLAAVTKERDEWKTAAATLLNELEELKKSLPRWPKAGEDSTPKVVGKYLHRFDRTDDEFTAYVVNEKLRTVYRGVMTRVEDIPGEWCLIPEPLAADDAK